MSVAVLSVVAQPVRWDWSCDLGCFWRVSSLWSQMSWRQDVNRDSNKSLKKCCLQNLKKHYPGVEWDWSIDQNVKLWLSELLRGSWWMWADVWRPGGFSPWCWCNTGPVYSWSWGGLGVLTHCEMNRPEPLLCQIHSSWWSEPLICWRSEGLIRPEQQLQAQAVLGESDQLRCGGYSIRKVLLLLY